MANVLLSWSQTRAPVMDADFTAELSEEGQEREKGETSDFNVAVLWISLITTIIATAAN